MTSVKHWGPSRLSISTRLTLWYGTTVLILLSLLSVFSYTNFHFGRHDVFDQHLSHEIRELTPFLRLEGQEPRFSSLDQLRSVAFGTHGLHSTYVRLLSVEGNVLYESPNLLARGELPVRIPEVVETVNLSRDWDDNPARTRYKPLLNSGGTLKGWLEVTGFEWSLHEQLSRLGRGLLAGTVLSVLLEIIGGYVLARRSLMPVVALTDAANEIRASDLGSRLPVKTGVSDELTDLTRTINAMLARIQDSFERERRFSDNAAHELLTPLATLANASEIALRRGRSAESYRETLQRQLIDIEEMTHTVRSLLQLSRIAQLNDIPKERVDLSSLSNSHVSRLQKTSAAKKLDLSLEAERRVVILAGERQIGEMLDNLLDNSIKYTPAGGEIRVEVTRDGRHARLAVADTGIGFAENRADDLFERFYRGDSSLVQAQSGSGLGLALVKTIAEAYGGSVSARSQGLGSGSTFEVIFPLDATTA
jgi:two-component system heavy metal sensor histidine kinase CusS